METESDFWHITKQVLDCETNLDVFKTWPTVLGIPLYHSDGFYEQWRDDVELLLGKIQNPLELDMWREILKEPILGHTKESYELVQRMCFVDIQTTTWALKSAHHVLTYNLLSKKSVLNHTQIVEFGAGIGDTARTILDLGQHLGYNIPYYILDLPATSRLSKFYLQKYPNVIHVNDLYEIPQKKNTLFIGTWSLSEVPYEYRNEICQYFKGQDYLIVFQKEVFNYDNMDYFLTLFPMLSETWYRLLNITWHDGGKGNYYLVAKGDNNDYN